MAAGAAAAKEPLAVAAELESGLLIFTMYLIAEQAMNTPARGTNYHLWIVASLPARQIQTHCWVQISIVLIYWSTSNIFVKSAKMNRKF